MDLSRRGFIKLSAGAAAAGGTLAGAGDAAAAQLDAPRLLAQAGTPAKAEILFVLNPNERDGSLQFSPEQVGRFATEELRSFSVNHAGNRQNTTRLLETGWHWTYSN